VSGNLLLFSGVRGDGTSQACPTWVFDDTWTFDGHRWTQLHPASPPGRSFGSLAFDESTRQTILFGGGAANSDPARNDTWTWNGATWTQRQTAPSPPPFAEPSMAYDADTASVILFGTTPSNATSTWLWNAKGWAQATPAHTPPFRWDGSMAYDAARRQVVLFGGYQVLGEGLGDTWTWNGTDWQEQHPPTNPPGFAGAVSLAAYDPVRRVVVLLAFGQTWTWDGLNWSQQHPPVSPLPRAFARMAYDQAVGKVVLFGGKIVSGLATETVTNETWLWDGTTWTLAA
jgi:hypothetical protein